MGVTQRSPPASARGDAETAEKSGSRSPTLPVHQGQVAENDQQARKTPGIKPQGESGRAGFHPTHFFRIAFRSSSKVSRGVNILWPVVPAAIACRYTLPLTPTNHMIIFILAYIAMVPCANMIGFAGQQLARKVPHVFGVLTETT